MFRVDADAHIDETEETWEYMTQEEKQYRPVCLDPPPGVAPVLGDHRSHRFWFVDGQLTLRNARDDKRTQTTTATRELLDVPARVRHMDELGIDVQVIYPTYMLFPNTTRPEVDLALCRAYNRWLADKTAQSNGRLRWMIMPPTLNMDKVEEELRFGKEHGACGVYKRTIDHDRRVVSDPYFFPLYETAQRLDLAIGNHAGGNAGTTNVGTRTVASAPRAHSGGQIAVFSLLATTRMTERFPRLRFGVIEAMASWVPYVITELKAKEMFRVPSTFEDRPFNLQQDFLHANRFYVTCEVTDDLPWLLRYGAEDSLMIGTDYTHSDQSGNIHAHETIERMGEDGEIPMAFAQKILGENARTFYGL